jgi:hypothetical protein
MPHALAFAAISAMKRGSAKAATCTSGVQYLVAKPSDTPFTCNAEDTCAATLRAKLSGSSAASM